jgi:hypothetical protein
VALRCLRYQNEKDYLGTFHTNYIIFRNVEIFKKQNKIQRNIFLLKIIFQVNIMLFINSDQMHFCIVYHNLDNYNVHVWFIGCAGEEW